RCLCNGSVHRYALRRIKRVQKSRKEGVWRVACGVWRVACAKGCVLLCGSFVGRCMWAYISLSGR
ncbi:MAG: hypothetical protein FWD76_05845, partial [Firmicutes bacterium]|nr:hypothetical protein [Bacillota bacterium]